MERLASDLTELSTRQSFAFWLAGGEVLRGWARCALGDTAEGISWMLGGIDDWRATGSMLCVPYFLALKAEALYLADRTSEALKAIWEAEALTEEREERWWSAELHRLRGVFLTAMGAEETQIEASFCAAITTAKQQKSVSAEKLAEATYVEYRRQKATTPGGVDSDYLFGNFLLHAGFRPTPRPRTSLPVSVELRDSSKARHLTSQVPAVARLNSTFCRFLCFQSGS